MSEFDKLIKKHGSGGDTIEVSTPFADLINKHGSGAVTAVAPASAVEPTSNQPSPPISQPSGDFVSHALPVSYKDKIYTDAVTEEAKSGLNKINEGWGQFSKQMPVSAIGNIGLGVLQGGLSPITPLVKGAEDIISKAVPGNPKGEGAGTGEKLLAILPIKGSGQFIKSRLPSSIAIENLISAIGKEDLPRVVQRMKANERISPMDASNSVLQVAQKLAVTEGKHQPVLSKFSETRVSGADDAVKMAFDDNLGVPVNALEKINEIKKTAKETGATLINPVVEKSKPADITNLIETIDKTIADTPVGAVTLKALKAGETPTRDLGPTQTRIYQLRNEIRGDWTDKTPMFSDVKGDQGLHRIQKDLRYEAQTLLDSPVGSDKLLGGQLMNLRNKIVDTIDKAAPGYKDGLAKYADDMEVQEAFERGFSLFGKSPKITNRPEFLEAELKTAKPEVVEAMKEGGRIAIDSMTRGFKNSARKGEDLVASEFNADKIKALYGEKEAKQLINRLEDERAIANTDTKLYQNSQTAMRLKNDNRVPQPLDPNDLKLQKLLPYAAEGAAMTLTGGIPTGLGAGAYFAAKGANRYGYTPAVNAYLGKQNMELSKLLTAEGEDRKMLIKILEDRISPPKTTMQIIKHLALPVLPP